MICAVANHKGGVGKTSAACNLGTAMSIKGFKVLAVDNDPQANLTKILQLDGVPMGKCLYELLDPATPTPPLAECIYRTHHQNLWILPNVESTSGLELSFMQDYPESFNTLRRVLRAPARERFDLVLIDCPPTLSIFVAQALHAADAVLVPVDAGSGFSMDGLQNVLTLIASIRDNGNPDLRFLKMLVNRVDRRTSICQAVLSDLRERFGADMMFDTTIGICTDVQKSEYLGDTIFRLAPKSRAVQDYRDLAKEMSALLREVQ